MTLSTADRIGELALRISSTRTRYLRCYPSTKAKATERADLRAELDALYAEVLHLTNGSETGTKETGMTFTKTVTQATVKNCQREGMGEYYDPYSRVKCDDWAIDATDRAELATIAAQHGATRFVVEDDRVIFYEGSDGVTKTRVQFIDHRDPVAVEVPAVVAPADTYGFTCVGDPENDTFPWAVVNLTTGAEVDRYTHRSIADQVANRMNAYTDEEQAEDAAYLASTAWRFATDQERRTDDLLGNLGRLAPVGPEE